MIEKREHGRTSAHTVAEVRHLQVTSMQYLQRSQLERRRRTSGTALIGRSPQARGARRGIFAPVLFVSLVFAVTRAGIQPGDYLIRIDGRRVTSVIGFQKELYLAGIKKELVLELFRDGETRKVTAKIEARPKQAVTH